MHSPHVPSLIQFVGLACVPVPDMPDESPLARKPVAAAVIAVREQEDGRRELEVRSVSDALDAEFPLPVLLDGALADAPTIITPADRALLGVEAASRRFFVEPQLARMAAGRNVIDPVGMFAVGDDERALCRRLGISAPFVGDRDVELAWSRHAPEGAEGVAIAAAVSRLMLWAHAAAFHAAVPDPFFELLLPLRDCLFELERKHPILAPTPARGRSAAPARSRATTASIAQPATPAIRKLAG